MSWLSRLKNAFHPRRLDEDLDQEWRDHLERRAAALRAQGFTTEEAQREARVRFGNVTRLKEESRSVRLFAWLDGTIQDLRYGWRGMWKSRAFASTAMLSLALAIGANTAIYAIADAAILRPLPVHSPDQLFTLSWPEPANPGTPANAERYSFSYPEFLRFTDVTKSLARLGLFSGPFRAEMRSLDPEAPIEKINRAYVSGEAFDILGIRPAIGALFSKEQDRVPQTRALAVISYDFWGRRFQQNPGVVGRRIAIDDKEVEIIGVTRKGFWGVEPGKFVDIWLPGALQMPFVLQNPGAYWLQMIGHLAPGISPKQVQAHLQPSFHDFQTQLVKLFPAMPEVIKQQILEGKIRVRSAATGISDLRMTFVRPLWILFGVAAGILLMACANVASLLLARSTARESEMAMRVALGAGRIRLIRQMLTESLIISFMAGALGWLLARSFGSLLVRLLSTDRDPVQLVLAIDTRVLFFCIAVSAASAVLFGLAPAWQTSGVQPVRSLKTSAGQIGKLRLGKLFVTIQVACAFCLIAVGASFLFSLANLLRVNPGFDPQNVTVLNLSTKASNNAVMWLDSGQPGQAKLRNDMLELQQAVANQPAIQAAAMTWMPNFGGSGWLEQIFVADKGSSHEEEILYPVSPGYFAALQIPFVAGRDFKATEAGAAQPVPVVVNEAFARKYFDHANPLGKQFSYVSRMTHASTREIVIGVVADTRFYNLRSPIAPIAYLPIDGNTAFNLYLRSRLSLGQTMRIVNRQMRRLGSGMQIHEVASLEGIIGNTLVRERLLAGMGGAFAFFGILLAGIGLFGLVNYSVGRRTKEIGVRMALGAHRPQIVSLVLKGVMALISLGIVIGLAGGLAILGVLKSLLFGIRTVDPIVTGTAVGCLLLTGLLAASLPAHRAATVDPMRVLREE